MVSFADFSGRGPHNWIVHELRQAQSAATNWLAGWQSAGVSAHAHLHSVCSSTSMVAHSLSQMPEEKKKEE